MLQSYKWFTSYDRKEAVIITAGSEKKYALVCESARNTVSITHGATLRCAFMSRTVLSQDKAEEESLN